MIARLAKIVAFGLCLTITGFSMAAAGRDKDKQQDQREFRQDLRDRKTVDQMYKKLSHGIDLWHDANLKGDFDKIEKYQTNLYAIIREDLRHSRGSINRYEQELNRSLQREKDKTVREDYKEFRDDLVDLNQIKELMKAKEALFVATKRSQAFSNKFRLLNDYLLLLARERKMARVELAEDLHEIRKK